jgi:hypothetical protein
MTRLKTLYEEAGYQVGTKEYIDNIAIRDMLKPIVRLLLAKREEALNQNQGEAEYIYRQLYLEIWKDTGMTFIDLTELSDRNNQSKGEITKC